MLENKNIKNTAVATETFGLSWPFCLSVPESKLSHNSQNIHGDVPSLSRPCGKTIASLKNNLVLQSSLKHNEAIKLSLRSVIRTELMFFSAKRDVFPLMQTAVWNKPIGGSIVVRELDLRHRRARQQ